MCVLKTISMLCVEVHLTKQVVCFNNKINVVCNYILSETICVLATRSRFIMVISQSIQFVRFGNNIKVVSDDTFSKAICMFQNQHQRCFVMLT